MPGSEPRVCFVMTAGPCYRWPENPSNDIFNGADTAFGMGAAGDAGTAARAGAASLNS